jgi:hypothetical protein
MIVLLPAVTSVLAFAVFAPLTAYFVKHFDPTNGTGVRGWRAEVGLLGLVVLILCLGLHVVMANYTAGLVFTRFGEFEIGTRLIGLSPLFVMFAWLLWWWRILHTRER